MPTAARTEPPKRPQIRLRNCGWDTGHPQFVEFVFFKVSEEFGVTDFAIRFDAVDSKPNYRLNLTLRDVDFVVLAILTHKNISFLE